MRPFSSIRQLLVAIRICVLPLALSCAPASYSLDLHAKVTPHAEPLIQNGTAVGFVVGIVRGDEQQVLAYGETEKGSKRVPNSDTVYEIGSVSKVFTGVLLARLAAQKRVALDAPIQRYLPKNVRAPVAGGKPITLRAPKRSRRRPRC